MEGTDDIATSWTFAIAETKSQNKMSWHVNQIIFKDYANTEGDQS